MKRLYVFSIRTFVGPFLVTLAISMFLLIMQFLWKYIDDLMGKGLHFTVILELLFYVSASLIPLALPLAILLSSIMTMGNLAENNELTALKASGLSLFQILKPLLIVVIFIASATFYFANYVIPVANLKWHSLIYDIQNTKISALLTPGVYSNELDGYAIKIEKEKGNAFERIIIHDHTDPNNLKTIRAKHGKIYKSTHGNYLFFELNKGVIAEEMEPHAPSFTTDGKIHLTPSSSRPARRSSFELATYKIDLSGFSLQRSRDELFANKHEMLNVFQISNALDSVRTGGDTIVSNFVKSIKNDHPYFQSLYFQPDSLNLQEDSLANTTVIFEELDQIQQQNAIQAAQSKLRQKNQNLAGQEEYMAGVNRDMNAYWIEFHRKFALTFTIIVLFFIGAPLGAIVKKGGFGAPVVIAALLFMIYFVLISIGDSLASSQVVSAFFGMWFASMVLVPIAFVLMRAAAKDTPLFKKVKWLKIRNIFHRKNESSLPNP